MKLLQAVTVVSPVVGLQLSALIAVVKSETLLAEFVPVFQIVLVASVEKLRANVMAGKRRSKRDKIFKKELLYVRKLKFIILFLRNYEYRKKNLSLRVFPLTGINQDILQEYSIHFSIWFQKRIYAYSKSNSNCFVIFYAPPQAF